MAKLTSEEIIRLLDYDPLTGIFVWKRRPREMFPDQNHYVTWNIKFVGKIAGGVYGNGYRYINIEPKAYLAHRLAWLIIYGEWPKSGMDHINGEKDDNRIVNLRLANQSQNLQNQKLSNKNTSGFSGVVWHKQRGRWAAQINKDNKKISLGLYDTKEEAYAAFLAGKRKHHTFNPVPRNRDGLPATP